jgi:RNA polymerase sigma-70 factor (ECF subfamily)
MNTNEDFKAVYEKYLRCSVRIARQVVKDEALAEDIGQEVFYHLYRVAETVDLSNERKLHALIVTATYNKAKDHLKKAHVNAEVFSDEEEELEFEDTSVNLEEMVLHKEENVYRSKVLAKLREQNPKNYDILIKVKFMDIPPEIVAQEYGITTNNVNNRILRTKHWLNKELQKIYTDEDEDS